VSISIQHSVYQHIRNILHHFHKKSQHLS
jgi:hypothetical protein